MATDIFRQHHRPPPPATGALHVDCDRCLARGPACSDCVVTVLLGTPAQVSFDPEEQAALQALADSGLVPPLRLVPGSRRVRAVQAPLEDFPPGEP